MLCVWVHGYDPGRVSDGSWLALSSALLFFSGNIMCLLLLFLAFGRFCFVFCSRWSFVDVSLIFSCPADHVLLRDWQPRTLLPLFLRNLVSGYERGRVFPAGVGPGSPSRDAANWLPSRFSLSVKTRRRYGWLRMVFPGVRLFRTPIWCPSGGVAARERQGALSQRVW